MNITTAEIRQELETFYRSAEPGRSGSRVSEVTLLGIGYEADVFAFSLKAGEAASAEPLDLVLRVYGGEGTVEKAAREFSVMGRLREVGYPVPRVSGFKPESSLSGRPFMIMERIHGDSLGAWYWSESEERQHAAQALLLRLMAELHALEGGRILPDSPLAGSHDPARFIDYELSSLADLMGQLEGRKTPSL